MPIRFPSTPIEDFAREVERMLRPPYNAHYRAVPWKDIGKDIQEPDWLVEDLLQANDVSILAGKEQSGKTFAATEIALSVARNVKLTGFDAPEDVQLNVPQQRGVVYLAAESSRGVVQLRLPAYMKHHGMGDEEIPFVVITQAVNFFGMDVDIDRLISDIKYHIEHWKVPLGLITIDTLSAVTPGLDEIKGSEVSKVRDRINRLRDVFKCHIQIVAHLNANGDKVRGHTSLTADVETVLKCYQTDTKDMSAEDENGKVIREIVIDKQKDGPAGIKFRFKLNVIELGVNKRGKPITSCVCVPPEFIERTPTGREALGMVKLDEKKLIVMRALRTAMSKQGLSDPKDVGNPAGTVCVKVQYWREELEKLTQSEDEDDDKARERAKKMIQRTSDEFVNMGLIGRDRQWAWRTKRRVQGIDRPYSADKTAAENETPGMDPALEGEIRQIEDTGQLPFA